MSDQYPSSEAGGFDARPPVPTPEPAASLQPWHRQVRFMLPIGLVAGLVLGAVATGGSSATSTPNAATPSTAATVSAVAPVTTTVTATRTVRSVKTATATKTAPAPGSARVQAVLDAWTNAGPQPDKQARAMQRLAQEWPTLAQALEAATGVTVPKAAAAAPTTATTRQTSPPAPGVYYANCAAARAAGAAPIYVGQPGYRAGLDRDGDGIACE